MVLNADFAYLLHAGVNRYANSAFTTFAQIYSPVCTNLHHICAEQIWSKSIFSSYLVQNVASMVYKKERLNYMRVWKSSLRKQPTFSDFPRNDGWKTRAEIPHWWRITSQIWVGLLIVWKWASINQNHDPNLGNEESSVWNFCTTFCANVILRGNQRWSRELSAVLSGYWKFRQILC